MRYFLDFDRTLFDTDGFVAYVAERFSLQGEKIENTILSATLISKAEKGCLMFEPGELSRFLYEDAASFLREKENAVTIITFGNKALQECKIKSALHGIPRMSVMYTGDVRKGDFLAPHTHLHDGALAIDDSRIELEVLSRGCPGLALCEIRRDGTSGDGRWQVIRSLAEVP